MSLQPVAVEGMVIKVQPPAKGQVTVLTPPSTITSVNGKKAYIGPIDIKVDNITMGPLGSVTPGTAMGKISPLAQNSSSENKKVMRKNDISAPLSAIGAQHNGPNGAPMPSPIICVVKIENAGQTIFKSA
jgi:hypothetical protein